jgi:hypothetical protein
MADSISAVERQCGGKTSVALYDDLFKFPPSNAMKMGQGPKLELESRLKSGSLSVTQCFSALA